MIRLALFVLLPWISFVAVAVDFSSSEISLIESHGPWPTDPVVDDSNRVSGNPLAIKFGEQLFFERELSVDTRMSCAGCHLPQIGFTDGQDIGFGRGRLTRNTTSVLNIGGNRWFGWGGENDSLWAQSIRPILAADELASSSRLVKEAVLDRDDYRDNYQRLFGSPAEHDEELVLVNIAKALAAYQETLFSPRAPFDDFRDALLANDQQGIDAYPESAKRGLKLFIGEGRCNVCHLGPRFSSGEFGDIGIPFFVSGGVDAGRYAGIKSMRANRFNLLGKYNDGKIADNALASRQVRLTHRNWGEFKVPGLRDVSRTAPYMHNGSLQTLPAVIDHYSEIDEDRLHADGEKILRPLNLSARQKDDLLSFLKSLGSEN